MAVNAQHNGEFLPDIILLTQCYYHRGTRLNVMKRFCLCSPRRPKHYVREIRNGLCDTESVVFRDFVGNDYRLRHFTVEV